MDRVLIPRPGFEARFTLGLAVNIVPRNLNANRAELREGGGGREDRFLRGEKDFRRGKEMGSRSFERDIIFER